MQFRSQNQRQPKQSSPLDSVRDMARYPSCRAFLWMAVMIFGLGVALHLAPMLVDRRLYDKQGQIVSSSSGHVFNASLGYNSLEEMEDRFTRFPPKEDRVRIYMSQWYLPPCDLQNDRDAHIEYAWVPPTEDEENIDKDGLPVPPTLYIREVAVTPAINASSGEPLIVSKNYRVGMDEDGLIPSLPNHPRIAAAYGTVAEKGVYAFFAHGPYMDRCLNKAKGFEVEFCVDVYRYMYPAWDAVLEEQHPEKDPSAPQQYTADEIPMLLQFGDAETTRLYIPEVDRYDLYPHLPVMKKFRHALSREQLSKMTTGACHAGPRAIANNAHEVPRIEPIVWLLTHKRHFGMLHEIQDQDRPWEEKHDVAVFRGGLTGVKAGGLTLKELEEMSDHDRCMEMSRCRLVYKAHQSQYVNASLVSNRKGMPERIGNVPIFGEPLSFAEMMEFKAIIMLEGNDLSSGFKWALLTNSVVMTKPVVYTSWAMEELLEPWVHYVPLGDDLDDVEEKMKWILNNDQQAKQIARNGKLWMLDMVFHPDAAADDAFINQEMVRRYRTHFVYRAGLKQESDRVSAAYQTKVEEEAEREVQAEAALEEEAEREEQTAREIQAKKKQQQH